MKVLVLAFSLMTMNSVFAQIIETDENIGIEMKKLAQSYVSSDEVQDLKSKIEETYNVACISSSKSVFPAFTKRITYKAKCKGIQNIKHVELKIVSKFHKILDHYEFQTMKYTVNFK